MSDHKDSDVPRQVKQGGLESERSKAPAPSKSAPNEVWESKCLAQATALLNCAANGGKKIGYNEIKCQNLLRALRTCCEAEVRAFDPLVCRPAVPHSHSDAWLKLRKIETP
jgi:hypothetical protein